MNDKAAHADVKLQLVERLDELPWWLSKEMLALAFHSEMKPYEDKVEDVSKALDYCLRIDKSKPGGFLVLATRPEALVGGLLMLRTGMDGYIPPWILLMVFVSPELRGQGLGGKIIDMALEHTGGGDIKLHVEHDNPAQHLYKRVGFTSKYLEMRLSCS